MSGKTLSESRITSNSYTGAIIRFLNQNVKTSGTPTFASLSLNGTLDMNSNLISNLATPVSDSDAATKLYVDSLFADLVWKNSVRVATVASGTLASDFENGDTIDDVVLVTGDRILIKNQGSGIENGVYIVNASGAPTRSSDFDTGESIANFIVSVEEGTINESLAYICSNDAGSDVVGTDSLVFSSFGGSSLTAGDGIDIVANVVSVDITDLLGTGLEDDGSNNFRIASSVAGAGLTGGSGSALAVGAGDGITVNANDVQVNVSDIAGTNLEDDGSNNLRISATAAGAGLTGGGASVLAVGAGDGITVNANDVQVNVSDIVGTGIEDDGSNNLRIASSVAGAGLTGGSGSALAVGAGDGITVNANDVQVNVGDIAGTGIENDGSNNLRIASTAAGTNLTGGSGSALAVNLTTDTYYITSISELSSAITAIGVSGNPSRILIAPGTYSLTSTITLPNSVYLQGSGPEVTIFQINNAAMTIGINSGTDCYISGITIDGNTNSTVDLIKTVTKTDIKIENCQFIGNTGTDIIAIHITNGSDRITITNCYFNTLGTSNSTGVWIDADSGSANGLVTLSHSFLETIQYPVYCLSTSDCDELIISNCYMTCPALATGIAFTAVPSRGVISNCILYDVDLPSTSDVQNIIFSNNYIHTSSNSAGFFDFTNCSISNNIFNTTLSATTVTDCSVIGNSFRSLIGGSTAITSDDSVISGNYFNNVTNGIIVTAGSTVISGNYFETCTRSININSTTGNCTVSGNSFISCTTGVLITTSVPFCTITSNIFSGTYTRGIYFLSANTFTGSCSIVGNTFDDAATATELINTAGDGTGVIINSNTSLVTTTSVTGTVNIIDYASNYVITNQNNTGGSLVVPDLITGAAGTKIVIRIAGLTSGSFTLAPTSFANGTGLLFDTDEDYAVLEWIGSEWRIVENGTGNTPTFTISLTNVANTSARTTSDYRIDTIGNEVTFTASFVITPTASATTTSFRFTLPRRTTITNNYEIMMSAIGYDNTNDVALENLMVRGDSSNNEGFCQFTSNGNGSADHIVTVYAKYSVN